MARIYKTIRAIPGRPGYAQQVGLKYTKTASGRKSYIPGTAARGPSKALTSKINRVINRSRETKFVIDYPFNTQTTSDLQAPAAFSCDITSTNELYNILPRTVQGEADHNRVGSYIQPTALYNWTQVFLPYTQSNSTMSIYVDVYYMTCKSVKTDAIMANVPTGEMLDNGQGALVNYTGVAQNALFPVNKKDFVVLAHKRIKLEKGNGDPNNVLSAGVSAAATDTFPIYQAQWRLKIPVPKKLSYGAQTDSTPTNYMPFMCLGWHAIDGNGDTAPALTRIFCRSQSQLYYKDA